MNYHLCNSQKKACISIVGILPNIGAVYSKQVQLARNVHICTQHSYLMAMTDRALHRPRLPSDITSSTATTTIAKKILHRSITHSTDITNVHPAGASHAIDAAIAAPVLVCALSILLTASSES